MGITHCLLYRQKYTTIIILNCIVSITTKRNHEHFRYHHLIFTLSPQLKPKKPLTCFLSLWICLCLVTLDLSDSVTFWTVAARLLCPWDLPGKNPGVGFHVLLQAIFLTQGSKLCWLHWKWILYHWGTRETRLSLQIYPFWTIHILCGILCLAAFT